MSGGFGLGADLDGPTRGGAPQRLPSRGGDGGYGGRGEPYGPPRGGLGPGPRAQAGYGLASDVSGRRDAPGGGGGGFGLADDLNRPRGGGGGGRLLGGGGGFGLAADIGPPPTAPSGFGLGSDLGPGRSGGFGLGSELGTGRGYGGGPGFGLASETDLNRLPRLAPLSSYEAHNRSRQGAGAAWGLAGELRRGRPRDAALTQSLEYIFEQGRRQDAARAGAASASGAAGGAGAAGSSTAAAAGPSARAPGRGPVPAPTAAGSRAGPAASASGSSSAAPPAHRSRILVGRSFSLALASLYFFLLADIVINAYTDPLHNDEAVFHILTVALQFFVLVVLGIAAWVMLSETFLVRHALYGPLFARFWPLFVVCPAYGALFLTARVYKLALIYSYYPPGAIWTQGGYYPVWIVQRIGAVMYYMVLMHTTTTLCADRTLFTAECVLGPDRAAAAATAAATARH